MGGWHNTTKKIPVIGVFSRTISRAYEHWTMKRSENTGSKIQKHIALKRKLQSIKEKEYEGSGNTDRFSSRLSAIESSLQKLMETNLEVLNSNRAILDRLDHHEGGPETKENLRLTIIIKVKIGSIVVRLGF